MLKEPSPNKEKFVATIEKATPEDWQNYRDIIIEAFKNNPQAFSEKQLEMVRNRIDKDWQKRFSKENDNSFAFLAKVNSETVGAFGARKTKKEGVWFSTSLYLSRKYKIDRFLVVRQMLKAVEDELKQRGGKKIFGYLKEGEGQDRIKNLYERFGYKVNNDPLFYEEGYTYLEKYISVDIAKK